MKGYTIAVRCGGPKMTKAMLRLVARKLPGLLGGSYEAGVLCFGSRGHAERAGRLLLNSGWKVGKYIMEAEIDLKEHRIQVGQPVDGWESVDPEDLRTDSSGNRGVVMRYTSRVI
jgi:hypothetical protein